ncbi:hypothetical protein PIB30_095132, partial [Stylosanthes scabra]|nr:hypothetical protein [Stylosanthes scabra]
MGKAKKGIGSKGFIKRSQKQMKLLVKLLAKLRTQHWNREQFRFCPDQVAYATSSPEAFGELSGQEF